MDTVLSVICALEGTTITKEQLEATRLAKYINQLRRRTKNEHLARRAKSLLKKWREMVGIQQNATDHLAHLSQTSFTQPALDLANSPINSFIGEPIAPSQEIISDMHSNIDSADPPPLGIYTRLHPNFSNLVNATNNSDCQENMAVTTLHTHKEKRNLHPIRSSHVASPLPIVLDHSINSVFNLTNDSTVKINEAPVVIDIASDSDETDNHSSLNQEKSNSMVPAPILMPSTPSFRQRKLKKEKKSKDREGQVATNTRFGAKVSDGFQQAALTADAEIFSLSNSSMSSILSGDATSSYSQNKSRLNSNELTFTGRFKSVNNLDLSNHKNTIFVTGVNESEKHKIDEYSAYDSNASCSRLSPLTECEVKKAENLVDAQLTNATENQMPIPTVSIGYESNTRHEYLESNSPSQIPKRRGRKKGSKGVDSLIAKESSSLSQQIFFGCSTVKKVKTTKELFNEIQSRKLSVSMQSSTSNLSSSSTNRDLTSHNTFPRPTSSCSDTSMHSPHILETYSGSAIFASKVDDLANTDSDTVTSDPSHDSNKSQEIKECTSLDSNSNSIQSLPLAKKRENLIPNNVNNITTQLMHLIHSLSSPLSEIETEKVYQDQIIPCTCIVIEEVQATSGECNNSTSDIMSCNAKKSLNSKDKISCHNNQDNFPISQRSVNGEVSDTQPKLVKSIFDLDFDDNDDPLYFIRDEIQKPLARAEESKNNKSDNKNISLEVSPQNVSLNIINFSADAQLDNSNQERETIETQNAMLPVFTVHEDPDCVARQRFYIQTNKVTSFHINALHNYYIPNINGNWNSVESFTSFQSKHKFMDTMESYTVTNGADVVPKYGLLTLDRIRKDLSSLKSIKPYRAKNLKSLISPFLGVAKCLPTCRRARRRFRKCVTSSTANNIISNNFESPENIKSSFKNCNPLKVTIDGSTSVMYSHNENHVPMHVNTNVEKLPPSHSFYIDAISCNLLKLADDKVRDDGISDKSSNHGCQGNSPYSSSSSSGYSGRKEDQNCLNKNLQNKSTELNSKKSDMKRRKKIIYLEDGTKKKKQKRMRTTSNGTCSNLPSDFNSSDSENGTENDYKNEYENSNNEEYAIVQRPVGDGESCSNHIVLTIKKTPSKINSPANSITAFSPPSTADTANLKKSILDLCLEDTNISQSITEIPVTKKKMDLSKTNRTGAHFAYRRTVRKPGKSQSKMIDLELKHLFHSKAKTPYISSNVKLHNKLFFPHELSRDNASGIKERILNYSSSSSSSYDDDSEVENTSFVKKANVKKCLTYNNHNFEPGIEVKFQDDEDSLLTSLGDSDSDFQDGIQVINDTIDNCNDFQNNKMLESFNSIFADGILTNQKNAPYDNMKPSPHITALESLKNENSDTITRYCNNNNLDVNLSNELSNIREKPMKSLESTIELQSIGVEYCTGVRTSSDLASTSISDKNITRIQEFKEWHQVLQLKSYNNEPLIVLPYVLLE
ncbi:mediator of RNA polymerase II transcription subunit 26 isoform X2 [Drosophila teissieri]|nr:mediator of RNA polymerase II transcription subunit 26 isoform X2 [Drosophila teissieri]